MAEVRLPVSATHELDRSAALQQSTREFAGIYERNAYLVYNLALRVTADRQAAIDTACLAFLATLGSADPDAELPGLTVRRGLSSARKEATPEAAGDLEAQAHLRACATLPGPERAAIALVTMAGMDAAGVGEVLETTPEAAQSLLQRAWARFADAARLPGDAAPESYSAWLWAEPPTEVWERLYPSFYGQLVRRLNSAQGEEDEAATALVSAVAAAVPRPSRRQRRQASRAEKDARRSKPPGRLRRGARAIPWGWLTVLLVVGGAGAGAAYATGALGGAHPSSARGLALTSTRRLSPAQIARLRAEERQASIEYAAQQRLAARAARRQATLQAAAMRQARNAQLAAQRAAERTAAKRQQAARKRARQLAARQLALQRQLQAQTQLQQQQQAAQPPPYSQQTTPSGPGGSGSGPGSGSGSRTGTGSGSGTGSGTGSSGPTQTQAQQTCLYNANDGTYVCPQN